MKDIVLWAQTNPRPAGDSRGPTETDKCVRCHGNLGKDYVLGDPDTNQWIHNTCRMENE